MRIASFISSATEMLYGLGLGEQVVAVSHECDFPAEVLAKPKISFTNISADAPSAMIDRQVKELVAAGKPLYEIDVELLVRLAPDLIVTQAQCDVCAIRYDDVVATVQSEEALASTQIVALNPHFLHDILGDIRRLAIATNRMDEGAAYVKSLVARIDTVRARTGNLPAERRRRVTCIEWIEPLMVAANWTPELVDLAGGTQAATTAGEHSTYTDWETIRAFDPEVIVVLPCGFDLERTLREAADLPQRPGWNELTAVRAGNVYAVNGNALFNRSGPRIVDSLELLSRLVHPELYEDDARGDREIASGDGRTWQRLGDFRAHAHHSK
ncbi:MAG: cobalamin-binding protein [Planctomycetia bacterium]|nr:cobalamin-binding protein [Planctomycetia bacterium]